VPGGRLVHTVVGKPAPNLLREVVLTYDVRRPPSLVAFLHHGHAHLRVGLQYNIMTFMMIAFA